MNDPKRARPTPEPKPAMAKPAMQDEILALANLLRAENTALETMDFARAGSLLAAKHAAADALAAAWRAAEPGQIGGEALRELAVLAEENRQLLRRAMRVQRRVLDLVAKAARSAAPAGRYAAGGKMARPEAGAQSFKARF